MKTHLKHISLLVLSLVFVLCAALLSGCSGGNGQQSSSSASESEETSTAAASPTSQSANISSTAQSSPQSDNGYALPAGSSQSASGSASLAASSNTQAQTFQPQNSSSTSAAPRSVVRDSSGAKISPSEYDQIQTGMSYADVKKIIGSSGSLESEFGEKGSVFYTVKYRWDGTGTSGSFADCTFEDGKLTGKIQFGLN